MTSTASEIERIPAPSIARTIQSGVGRVASTPVTVSAAKTGHASGASTETG